MTTGDDYIELRFQDFQHQEILIAHLSCFAPTGFLEEEEYWSVTFPADAWPSIQSEFVERVNSYFPGLQYSIHALMHENWNRLWESGLRPIQITKRIMIVPTTEQHRGIEEGMISLIIEPKMSFGTGYHATTRLMVRLLEKHITGSERVLDVGTGTGILAVVARKLGASVVLGIDNDRWACENALENVRKNELDNIEIRFGSMEIIRGTYNVITANITKNDIVALLPSFNSHADQETLFIFSGILFVDAIEVEEEFILNGLRIVERLREDEWIAYALTPSKAVE